MDTRQQVNRSNIDVTLLQEKIKLQQVEIELFKREIFELQKNLQNSYKRIAELIQESEKQSRVHYETN
jgi:predicted RNase H-like nuclease (RuvC/YqgF family)